MLQWPSFPIVINTVSSYSVDSSSSVLLMRGSIERERSGLTLVCGSSTVSKPFRVQWFNSLLVCLTISWQSLKCKRRHVHSKYKSVTFKAESGVRFALHMYSSLCCCNGYNSPTLVFHWVKHAFNLPQCLCHWWMLEEIWAYCESLAAIMPQEEHTKFSSVQHVEGKETEREMYLTQLR